MAGAALVTGASGFLGRALCEAWRGRGRYIRAFARTEGGPPPEVDELVPLPDPFDLAVLGRAMTGVETVVHLGARVHQLDDPAADRLAEYRRVNVEWTRALAEAARTAGVRRFVFASSVKAVGEASQDPWTSATRAAPTDPYGVSKLEAEIVVRAITREAGLYAPILRLPLVYGPGMRANMLRLFELVDRGVPLPFEGLDNRRSLIFLLNVVSAIDSALEATAAGDRTWFVSDGVDLTSEQLVRMIAAALGRPARLLPAAPSLMRAAGWAGDLLGRLVPFPVTSAAVRRLTGSLRIDSSEFATATGFQPPYTVEQGMALTAAWFRRRRDAHR